VTDELMDIRCRSLRLTQIGYGFFTYVPNMGMEHQSRRFFEVHQGFEGF
jgi:hypothetical protein